MNRRTECLDPSVPSFVRPSLRGERGVRCYKVAGVGEFMSGENGFECTISLTKDNGSGGSDLVVRADSTPVLQMLVSTIHAIAEHETKAKLCFTKGYHSEGKGRILTANELREKAISFHVKALPAREWEPPANENIIALQEELF